MFRLFYICNVKQKSPDSKLKTMLTVYFVVAIFVAIISTLISTYVFHHGRYEDKPFEIVLSLCSLVAVVCIMVYHRRNVKKYEEQNKDRE